MLSTLADFSGSKLHADEQDVVREAADAMHFCEDVSSDPGAEQALSALYEPTDRLVESERLAPEKTRELTADIEDCGPFSVVR